MKTEYKVVLLVAILLLIFALFFPRSTIYNTYNYSGLKEKFSNQGKEGFENTNEPTLVLFKVNWCGYCQKFLPEWMKFQESSPIRTLIVDCEQFPDLSKKYNINGFPQVKYFPEGTAKETMVDYNGERTAEALQQFVKEMSAKEGFENEVVGRLQKLAKEGEKVQGAPAELPDHAMAYPFH